MKLKQKTMRREGMRTKLARPPQNQIISENDLPIYNVLL
jgi:hypothetical protein